MENYIVTGFNEESWRLWGVSWLVSIKELAKFDTKKVIIVGFGLSFNTKNKITDTGATLLTGDFSTDIRNGTIKVITDLAKKSSAIFAYWDVDVFFQTDISEIFEIAKNDLVVSANKSKGFLAGPSNRWSHISNILNIMCFFDDKRDFYDCLISNFKNFIVEVDSTWNFTDIPHLKDVDGYLTYKNQIQKVIHPTEEIKNVLSNRNILFWERYKDLYQSMERKISLHNLVPKIKQ
jgi:hypothetical protein